MNESARTTREEFEWAYAERSGVTVQWLHEHGRVAVSCECGQDLCNGWAMAHTLDTDQVLPADWVHSTTKEDA